MKKYLLVFTLMLLVGSFVFSHNVLAEVNDDFKTICIRLAGPDALLQGKCAEITPVSSSDFARLKCKEVAEALSDEDGVQDCENVGIIAPSTTGDTASGEGAEDDLIKGIYDSIGKFEELGITSANQDVPTFVGNILKLFFGIIGSVALVMFIYGGFGYMTSAGDPKKVANAKNTFIWASLGLLLVFGAYALVNFVISNL
ncbi:hypothetical protein A2223_01585 [Candidatus Falkowbacteria bacterium RIFOXYA2_FULL_35_8]|uniref:Uncharacterized protein n=1 Tax=Candidatus Falkowbacteria bacterium RIFOXYC2_FULL_36_12 TaxID=1798002 RepID=A0A1F5T3C6_9BACT|nr:MAG: hypothetical protein A2300_03005 [Candidatus Falkowbacteria bacterium RIFOXYB2_FULL_35_7]OGF33458.1 MAG: hypothetical protein A2478_02075 [Candidatus Falkowbacteria bacterium RIFOXYC2_FULL_36_12]OGF34106.1 MAG: hypothetical protein A2223_01585 [Candidatus Falkowbacteria bacterium RIFOXYA2_FULL_35_8]